MAQFLKVANLSELPAGSAKAVEVAGKAVALFNVEGKIYALDNTCRHRGGPLGEGFVEGDIVTCPWHGWQYKIPSGECLDDASIKVAAYPVPGQIPPRTLQRLSSAVPLSRGAGARTCCAFPCERILNRVAEKF
ncbi:MAG: hypothetical protein DMG21_13305 [Acidobacteria bacterium]|nr:MAG: hypothetical protein DMG21_13305 [Acidobacteriota bacterium]